MAADYHTIILGLGAMGSAAAAHLARRLEPRGEKVLGLEQFAIPHTKGSSHGQSRLIRLAYYEHPHYVPLLRRAYALWRELERDSGETLLHIAGGVYMGPADHELVAGSLRSAREHGLAHEALTRDALKKRYPQFELPGDFSAVYEPEAGFLLPEKAVAAYAALAREHGADLHAEEPAMEWRANDNGVEVRTGRATYRARHLVITAGAWTGRLLPPLASKIQVTRQVMLWFAPRDESAFMLGSFPCWCAAVPQGGLIYGPPMLPTDASSAKVGKAKSGLKISHHFPGIPADPETVDREPLPGDEAVVRSWIKAHLPAADGPLVRHCVCLYSYSPDEHFLIDRHPQHENVFFAAGFSGHGFKFAAVVGEILADLATTGGTAHPIDFLRLRALADSRSPPTPVIVHGLTPRAWAGPVHGWTVNLVRSGRKQP